MEAHVGIEVPITGGGAEMRENVTRREGGDEGTVMAPGGREGLGGEGRGILIVARGGAEKMIVVVVVVVCGVGEEGGMEVGHGGGTEMTETRLSLIVVGATGTLIEIVEEEEEEAGETVTETEVRVYLILHGVICIPFLDQGPQRQYDDQHGEDRRRYDDRAQQRCVNIAYAPVHTLTPLSGFTSSHPSPNITTGTIKVLGEASARPPLPLVARCLTSNSSQGKEKRAGRWLGGNVESKLH